MCMTNRTDNYQKFFGNENISTIWSAISDGLNLQKSDSNYSTIVNIFNVNVQLFKRTADFGNSLVILNKQFIKQVMVAVRALNVNVKKLQITRDEVSIPVKFQDIQNDRKTQLESQFMQQKHDRESYISQKPTEIDFTDNYVNAKITEEEINNLLKMRNDVDITPPIENKSKSKVSFNDIFEDIVFDEEKIAKNVNDTMSPADDFKYGEQKLDSQVGFTGGFISNNDTVEWLKMLNDKLDLILKHLQIDKTN